MINWFDHVYEGNCNNKKRCNKCGRNHHSLLHYNEFLKGKEGSEENIAKKNIVYNDDETLRNSDTSSNSTDKSKGSKWRVRDIASSNRSRILKDYYLRRSSSSTSFTKKERSN